MVLISQPTVAKRILDHLGLGSTGPRLAGSRVDQADSVEPEPAYDLADPVYEDGMRRPLSPPGSWTKPASPAASRQHDLIG